MNETRESWFLRVAEPRELWESTSSQAINEAATQLANDSCWSIFECASERFERTVLGAYYGARTGRGPMHSVAHVRFGRELLRRLPAIRLEHTPHNFTFGWPAEVAEAHFDLQPMDANAAEVLLRSVRTTPDLFHVLSRLGLLTEQVRLLRRPDCSQTFCSNVGQRLRKLSKNEHDVFEKLRHECEQAGFAAPTDTDFRT